MTQLLKLKKDFVDARPLIEVTYKVHDLKDAISL